MLDFAEEKHFLTANGQGSDRVSKERQLLLTRYKLHHVGFILQDGRVACFHDRLMPRNYALSDNVSHGIAGYREKKGLGRLNLGGFPHLEYASERILYQVIHVAGRG